MLTTPQRRSCTNANQLPPRSALLWLLAGMLGTLLSVTSAEVLAADSGLAVARAVIALGIVRVVGSDGRGRVLQRHDPIFEGDTLTTSAAGRAQFTFTDGARLALRPATQLSIEAYHARLGGRDEKIAMRLVRGGFRTVTGQIGRVNHAAYRMSTPYAVIGIRGTDWAATFEPNDNGQPILLIGVNEGGVIIDNDAGSLNLGVQANFNFAQVIGAQQAPQGLTTPPPALLAPLTSDLPPPPPPPPPIETTAEGSAAATTTEPQPATAAAGTETETTTTADGGQQSDVVFQYGNRCL